MGGGPVITSVKDKKIEHAGLADFNEINKLEGPERRSRYQAQLAAAINWAKEQEDEGNIDSLDNINGAPAYVYGCTVDNIVPFVMQEMQRDFFTKFGANVKFSGECPPGASWARENGHDYRVTEPYDQLQFLLENIEGTGISAEAPLKQFTYDDAVDVFFNPKSHGTLT